MRLLPHSSLGMGLAFVPSTGYVVGIFLIGKTVCVNTVHFTESFKKECNVNGHACHQSPPACASVSAFRKLLIGTLFGPVTQRIQL
jgi:hypothetical protein